MVILRPKRIYTYYTDIRYSGQLVFYEKLKVKIEGGIILYLSEIALKYNAWISRDCKELAASGGVCPACRRSRDHQRV